MHADVLGLRHAVQYLSYVVMQDKVAILRSSPATVGIPFIMLAVMLSLGVWGVVLNAEKWKDHEEDVAYAASLGTATNFELQLQQSYAPSITLATFVEQYSQWPTLSQKFGTIAESLMKQVW